MMKCITTARTFLFYTIKQHYYYHHLIRRRNCKTTRLWPQLQRRFYANTQATHALLPSDLVVVLADINTIAQPKGDIKVFLQTGALMLAAYMLANFVVPSIVLKQLDGAAKESESPVEAQTSNEKQPPKKMKKNTRD